MELQTVFYIMSIIYMSLMFILFILLLVAVLAIKAKINKTHEMINDRVNQAKSVTNVLTTGVRLLKYFVKK